MTIKQGGYIGIGINDPGKKLTVYDGYLRLQGTNNHHVDINDDEIIKYNGSPLTIGTNSNQELRFIRSNIQRAYLKQTDILNF